MREGGGGVMQLTGPVKASLGPTVLVQVFFRSRVGLDEEMWDKIPC